jgi:hypothetical protein
MPKRELRAAYETAFMSTLQIVATPRRHTNVLNSHDGSPEEAARPGVEARAAAGDPRALNHV